MRTLGLLGRAPALTCRELVELVTDYFEDALSARDRRRFEAHIAACDGCTIHIEQLRELRERLGALTPEDLPPATEDKLREAFGAWRGGG